MKAKVRTVKWGPLPKCLRWVGDKRISTSHIYAWQRARDSILRNDVTNILDRYENVVIMYSLVALYLTSDATYSIVFWNLGWVKTAQCSFSQAQCRFLILYVVLWIPLKVQWKGRKTVEWFRAPNQGALLSPKQRLLLFIGDCFMLGSDFPELKEPQESAALSPWRLRHGSLHYRCSTLPSSSLRVSLCADGSCKVPPAVEGGKLAAHHGCHVNEPCGASNWIHLISSNSVDTLAMLGGSSSVANL